MSLLPPLPIPAEGWLRSVNERYRGQDISPEQRPLRAMEDWAAHHGQPAAFGGLALSHLGGPAWTAIDAFFRAHTKLAMNALNRLVDPCGSMTGAFIRST